MSEAAVTAEGRTYEFTTQSGADTVAVGRKLADLLKPPQLLLLRGDLGTGKTTLVKGIAQALDAAEPDEVTSPTFTLIHEFDGSRDGKPVKLYHLDVYRLESERQLETLGLDELLTPDALVLVEWGEKFKSIRKRATGEIVIASEGGDARKITVTLKEVAESASRGVGRLRPQAGLLLLSHRHRLDVHRETMNRIPFAEVQKTLAAVLRKLGFTPIAPRPAPGSLPRPRATASTRTASTAFRALWPRFAMAASIPRPSRSGSARFGALERWDGRRGPGNLNALAAMERAIALGREHGVGCVALGQHQSLDARRHLRLAGGRGGHDRHLLDQHHAQSAALGRSRPVIGNNPLVIAVPRAAGPVVLDMAMSQFSYGALESYRKRGEMLPVDGGFDAEGNLTRDPGGDREVVAAAADRLLEGIRALRRARPGGRHDDAGPRHA